MDNILNNQWLVANTAYPEAMIALLLSLEYSPNEEFALMNVEELRRILMVYVCGINKFDERGEKHGVWRK